MAEDSALLREGIARLLTDAGLEVVGRAADATEALALVEAERPNVAILDIRMPPGLGQEGLTAARAIRVRLPQVGILLLSQYVEAAYSDDVQALGGSGVGYLLKDQILEADDLVEAVRRVAAGGLVLDPAVIRTLMGRPRVAGGLDDLSSRERAVLALMAEGHSNAAIGSRLFLGDKTVETHIRNIFNKLGIRDQPTVNRRVLAVLTHLRS